MSETTGRFSPEFIEVREKVGDALHASRHRNHPWSGCSDPDAIYEQMNRLADILIDQDGAVEAWLAFGVEYNRKSSVPA